MITVAAVCDYLKRFAPLELAAEWDNVGLLLGDETNLVRRVMTCLTVTPEVVAEAAARDAQMLVTHHPILFQAVKNLSSTSEEGRLLRPLLSKGIAVYSPHTAFDNAPGGINDLMARQLGLEEVGPLRRREESAECKIVVFVPEADLGRVSEALFAAGAGRIGHYSDCSFRQAGTGTFFGSDSTHPTVGKKGRREEVGEWRLEVVCPQGRVSEAIASLRKAHSYEEPAFDVYSLHPKVSSIGEGRIGRLGQAVSLENLAQTVKSVLAARFLQVGGDPGRAIQRVAIVCGAGGDYWKDAVAAKADALVTGEMRFHDCLAAQSQGLALLLPGHYATERPGIEELAALLGKEWPDLEVWASQAEFDPLCGV